jgi:hypothetical protein
VFATEKSESGCSSKRIEANGIFLNDEMVLALMRCGVNCNLDDPIDIRISHYNV